MIEPLFYIEIDENLKKKGLKKLHKYMPNNDIKTFFIPLTIF